MPNLKYVELTDNFWLPKIKMIQNATIAYGFDKCREEGRFENFLIAGKKKSGKVHGKMPFDDTDVYKIIEGASYSLISAPNKVLDAYLDSVIDIIKTGQEPDGYLTTWFTIDPSNPPAPWVQKTGKRWEREAASHELYNSGHMFEAAVAHFLATGKRNFLDLAIKNADLLVENFGPGKNSMPPGHQIVETGLIRLYRVTGSEKYLKLAKYFLDIRGDSSTHKLYGEYSQDHKPVVRQTEIVGHAVRAVYMYAGMTDIAAIYRDQAYLNAVMKIWNNLVARKIYLTGGIGARHEGESLGNDFELPNLTAYGETCASIGSVYWNTRLFMLTGDAKYFNLIERTMYNGLISGISSDGKNFFYVNPLEADSKFNFNNGSATRQPWFDCSCCPTNLIRFIPSIPGLIYAMQEDTLYINLYSSNKALVALAARDIKIEQSSNYPWSGDVKIRIDPEKKSKFTLRLRLPGWTQNEAIPGDLYRYEDTLKEKIVITVNGKEKEYTISRGYASITRTWETGDKVGILFPMKIRRVIAHPRVKNDSGLVALECGPVVYCVEGKDNSGSVGNLSLPGNIALDLEYRSDLFDGVNIIRGNIPDADKLSRSGFMAIPYFAWSNRGTGAMKVWLRQN